MVSGTRVLKLLWDYNIYLFLSYVVMIINECLEK